MATWLGEKLLLEATGIAKTLAQKQEDQFIYWKLRWYHWNNCVQYSSSASQER